uniref:Lens fiber membrane intrinsic protein n=1 Tax=Anas platyrhynchos TaxID=8839 RepID=A0A8B9SIH7_ANAPL
MGEIWGALLAPNSGTGPQGPPSPRCCPGRGGGSGCHPSCPPPPPPPQCPRRRLAAGVGILRCQPPGGAAAPRAFPAFVSPDNGSATCTGGGPQHPPPHPPPPPRPPHPSAGTDGHRRRDRGTEGRPWGTPLVGAEGGGRCRSGGGCCAPPAAWPCSSPPPPPTSGCSTGHRAAPRPSGCGTSAWGGTAGPPPAPRVGGSSGAGRGGPRRVPGVPNVPVPAAFWDATRVLMLLAVLAAATGFALGLSAAAAGAARRARARAAGVTLLLAGVLALLGLAVCTAGARSLLGPAPGAWRLSWSYLLAWVAVVLTGSAGLFHLCAAAKDPSPESSESGGP